MIILLDRNYFASRGNVNGGMLGLGATIAGVGAGIVVAALITPAATDRWGTTTWITAMLLLAARGDRSLQVALQRGLLVVPGHSCSACRHRA